MFYTSKNSFDPISSFTDSINHLRLLLALFVRNDFVWVGWIVGYDQLCCPASPHLLLGLDEGLGYTKVS